MLDGVFIYYCMTLHAFVIIPVDLFCAEIMGILFSQEEAVFKLILLLVQMRRVTTSRY